MKKTFIFLLVCSIFVFSGCDNNKDTSVISEKSAHTTMSEIVTTTVQDETILTTDITTYVIEKPLCPKLFSYQISGWMGAGFGGDISAIDYTIYENKTLVCKTSYYSSNLGVIETERELIMPDEDFSKLKQEIEKTDYGKNAGEYYGDNPDAGHGVFTFYGDEVLEVTSLHENLLEIENLIHDFSRYNTKTSTTDFNFCFDYCEDIEHTILTFNYHKKDKNTNYQFWITGNSITICNCDKNTTRYKIKKLSENDLNLLKQALIESDFMSFPEYVHDENSTEDRHLLVATDQGIYESYCYGDVSKYKPIDEAVEKIIEKYVS